MDIFTVRIEDVQPAKGVQLYTSRYQWIDAIKLPLEASCIHLANTILALGNRSQPLPAEKPVEEKPNAPALDHLRFHPSPVTAQFVSGRQNGSYDDILNELVKEHGLPHFDIELSCTTYLIYGEKMFKIANRRESKPIPYLLQMLPRNESGLLADSDLPVIDGWPQPQGMVQIALLAGKPKAGMRFEDVVLFAGVPRKCSHGSRPTFSHSWWMFSDWEVHGISTGEFRQSGNDEVIGS